MAAMGEISHVLVVGIVVLGPIWLALHYRSRSSQQSREAEEGQRKLDEMTRVADQMQTRIETLERLLDATSVKERQQS